MLHPNISCVAGREYDIAIGSFSLKLCLQFPGEVGKKKKQVKSWGQVGWRSRYFTTREVAENSKNNTQLLLLGFVAAACTAEGHARPENICWIFRVGTSPYEGSEERKLEQEDYKCMTSSGAGKASDYLLDHTI